MNARKVDPSDLEGYFRNLASKAAPEEAGVEGGTEPRRLRHLHAVRFNEIPDPGSCKDVVRSLVPEAHLTVLYGEGGVAKSILALSMGLGVASGADDWLGRKVRGGPVLYLDFELDGAEQRRRADRLAKGVGLDRPPDSLLYMSALGVPASDAFPAALDECGTHGVKLLIADSLGPAMQGNVDEAQAVIGFYHKFLAPFLSAGVAILGIDHQSKMQPGEQYRNKSAFGSVYKTNLARSVIQVEKKKAGRGALLVRLHHKKFNFGSPVPPFETELRFYQKAVTVALSEGATEESSGQEALDTDDRILLSLWQSPAIPLTLANALNLKEQTVKNHLTRLRKGGYVAPTGEHEGRAEQVALTQKGIAYLRTYLHKE